MLPNNILQLRCSCNLSSKKKRHYSKTEKKMYVTLRCFHYFLKSFTNKKKISKTARSTLVFFVIYRGNRPIIKINATQKQRDKNYVYSSCNLLAAFLENDVTKVVKKEGKQ